MEATVIHIGTYESLSAVITFKVAQTSIEFHKDLFPRQVLLLSQEHDKLIDVPGPVSYVLSNHRAMKIDEYFGLRAHHPLPLTLSKERITIYTPV